MNLDFSLLSQPKPISRVPGVPRVPTPANPVDTRDSGLGGAGHDQCPARVPRVPTVSRQDGNDRAGAGLGHVGHDWDTPHVPGQEARKPLQDKASEGLGHAGHVGHAKSTETENPRDMDAGAPFTPYCVPLPADRVTAMQAEIREAIGTLADAEGWTDTHRTHLLDLVARQPAFTLADDLAYFRERLASLRAAGAAAEAVNLVRTCGTCAYRAEYGHGARWRCVVARAIDWRHHAWLDAPEQANDCWYYERGKR